MCVRLSCLTVEGERGTRHEPASLVGDIAYGMTGDGQDSRLDAMAVDPSGLSLIGNPPSYDTQTRSSSMASSETTWAGPHARRSQESLFLCRLVLEAQGRTL